MTYSSDAVKDQLRPYAGHAIQIDAAEIIQQMNPGDGIVKSYVVLGEAPEGPNDPVANEIDIEANPAFNDKISPEFDITVRNISLKQVSVSPSELGSTLVGVNRAIPFSAYDGKSVAWRHGGECQEPARIAHEAGA